MSVFRLTAYVVAAVASVVLGMQFLDESVFWPAILLAITVALFVAARPAKFVLPREKITSAMELHLAKVGGTPAGITGAESVAELNDFKFTGISPVDFLAIFKLRPQDITPYTVDADRGCIVFVMVDADVLSKSKAPFLYMQQRNEARRVFAVPYDEAVKAMQTLQREDGTWGSLSQVMFVHSTGRCGSTLFSKVMGNLASITSLSEPDVFSMAVAMLELEPSKFSEADCEKVFRVGTFFHAYSALKQRQAEVVCIKVRSFAIERGLLLKKAVLEAKTVFLYRNAMDVVDSYCMAFFSHAVGRLARQVGLDSLLLFKVGKLHTIFPVIAPLMSKPEYARKAVESLGAVGLFTMGWLSCLDGALRMADAKILDAIFRYEELTTQKVELAKKVLAACRFKTSVATDEEAMRQVFEADAHGEDSRTVSARRLAKVEGPMYICLGDHAQMNALIACHKTIQKGDFVLPGTIL